MNTKTPEELGKGWIEAYNAGRGWVDRVIADDFEWIEKPSAAFPEGRVGDKASLQKAAAGNLDRTPTRRMDIVRIMRCAADEAVLEWVWTGVSKTGGPLEYVGVSFLKFKHDMIVRELDYITHWKTPADPSVYFNADGTWKV